MAIGLNHYSELLNYIKGLAEQDSYVEILSAQVRDANKQDDGDKFWNQDNEVDNLNEAMAVLNRLWFKMIQDFQDNNIVVDGGASLEQVTEWNKNLLDGWLMTFTISLPNTTIALCTC